MASARVSQEVVETALQPTDAKARVSQEVVETALKPDDPKGRVSHVVVETILKPDYAKARVSHVAVEVLWQEPGPARLSQLVTEVIIRNLHEDIYLAIID